MLREVDVVERKETRVSKRERKVERIRDREKRREKKKKKTNKEKREGMQKTDLDEFRCQRGRLRRFVRVARKPTNEGFPFLAIAFGADTLLSRCGKRARGVNFSIVYEIVRESFRPICYYFWPPTPSRKSIGDVRFLLEFRGANRHRIVPSTIVERQRDCFFFFHFRVSVFATDSPRE